MNESREDREVRMAGEDAQVKLSRKAYVSLVRRVRSNCHADRSGLQAVIYQMEYIDRNNKVLDGLSFEQTVAAFRDGIEQYKNRKL